MARLYCDGHWDVWDDKVTTPPGLYAPRRAFAGVGLPRAIVLTCVGTCRGVWPPRSYVLAAVANFFVPGACSVVGLRILNAVIGLSTVPVIAALLHVLRTPYSLRDPRHWVEALAISLFPMAHHFVFFAYTDTASTFLVLFGLLWALRGHPAFSALVRRAARASKRARVCALMPCGVCAHARGTFQIFLVSLTFRQTNAVWMAFAAALYVLQRRPLTAYVQLSTANATVHGAGARAACRPRLRHRGANGSSPPVVAGAVRTGLVDECRRLVRASLQNLPQLLVEVWPFAVPAALFAAFLVWNDGIVLGTAAQRRARLRPGSGADRRYLSWVGDGGSGDRAAHVSAFHLPQLLYFAVIAVAFSAPAFLSLAQLRQMVAAAKRQLSTYVRCACRAMCWRWPCA